MKLDPIGLASSKGQWKDPAEHRIVSTEYLGVLLVLPMIVQYDCLADSSVCGSSFDRYGAQKLSFSCFVAIIMACFRDCRISKLTNC